MNAIAVCAAQTLREHPHPALRLTELLELVAERVDRTLDAPRLRATLEEHPGVFRLLDPWRGPWRGAAATSEALGTLDPWVVVATDPDPDHPGEAATVRLRESVRWLARGIDSASPHRITRWYGIALSEREIRARCRVRAA